MTVQEKMEMLKTVAPDGMQFSDSFFTEDCERITHFDLSVNIIWFLTTGTASCGCCSETLDHQEDLDWFLDHMSDSDFTEFVEWLKEKNK